MFLKTPKISNPKMGRTYIEMKISEYPKPWEAMLTNDAIIFKESVYSSCYLPYHDTILNIYKLQQIA